MPITQEQLANQIEAAYDAESDTEVNPSDARRRVAEKIAEAVAQFVQGRETVVTGTSATGGAGTGIIQ